jgi:hypothetical protein
LRSRDQTCSGIQVCLMVHNGRDSWLGKERLSRAEEDQRGSQARSGLGYGVGRGRIDLGGRVVEQYTAAQGYVGGNKCRTVAKRSEAGA